MFAVITENDESRWSDDTGILYHFPKRYSKILVPGAKVAYYKGKLRKSEFREARLTDSPHYFGLAEIESVYSDPESPKGDLFATIKNYQKFVSPVFAKQNGGYIELIPENRKTNYWYDGVRLINEVTFNAIVSLATISEVNENQSLTYASASDLNDLDQTLESGLEGDKRYKYVSYYERDRDLRRKAIMIHGATCVCCGFNFRDFYGDYAEGFIHIHHINPVSEMHGPTEVIPETDLVPLCPNCHAVIHRKKNYTLSVLELQAMISSQRLK